MIVFPRNKIKYDHTKNTTFFHTSSTMGFSSFEFFLRRPTLRLSATQNACDEVSVNLRAYIFTYLHTNVL